MDSRLMLQAQIRAGANVHEVHGLMNAYGICSSLAARGDANAANVLADIERALRKFIATATFDRVACAAWLPAAVARAG